MICYFCCNSVVPSTVLGTKRHLINTCQISENQPIAYSPLYLGLTPIRKLVLSSFSEDKET